MSSFFELTETFNLSWVQWALAIAGCVLAGISKAGLKGIGVIIVTIMALVFGSKASTGILLPLLVVGDLFAIVYYRQHVKWNYLWKLMPWMITGILFGVWAGKDMPEAIFKQGMAVIILLTVAMMLLLESKKITRIPDNWWFAGLMGLGAGFTTMIGNLAGAFSNIYFLAIRFPKNEFIGTAAWLFFFINVFKLPFHYLVWRTITPETLALNLRIVPAVITGFFIGARLIKIIQEKKYRQLILLLTAMGAILIFFR